MRDEFQHTTHSKHLYKASGDSVFGTVTRLHDGRLKNRGSIPDKGKRFFSSPKCPKRLQVFYTTGTGGSFPGSTGAKARR